MQITPEMVTKAYERRGLPATLPADQRAAWEDWTAGKGAPLRLLPKNGDTCRQQTIGGSPECGYPLLIDGSCVNISEHGKPGVYVPITRLREFAERLSGDQDVKHVGAALTVLLDELEEGES